MGRNSLWAIMISVFAAVGCASTKQAGTGSRQPISPEIPATPEDGTPQADGADSWDSYETHAGDDHSSHDHGAMPTTAVDATGTGTVYNNPQSPLGQVASNPYVATGTSPTSNAVTPTSADPNVVVFRIRAGTGRGPWNDAANPIRGRVGQTLEIFNDDSVQHWIHTNFAPFFHPFSGIAPGQSARYQLASPSPGPHYDHLTGGAIHMIVTQ